MNQNEHILKSFVAYCEANPQLRFWQALANWCGKNYVLVADSRNFALDEYEGVKDTFNFTGIDK